MGRRNKALGVAAIAAAAVAIAGVAPASADAQRDANPASASVAAPSNLAAIPGAKETKKVTLITGDQVWLTRTVDASGKKTVRTRIVPAVRAHGTEIAFAQWGTPERYFVVPSDVLPMIGSRVDPDVFDVAGLIDSGASGSNETRVIVSFTGGASGLAAASTALSSKANASGTTVLPSANAVALKVPAGKGAGLFDQLETAASRQTYVSLDRRVKASDTTSMPQIGATKAWASGYTGKGTKIAVLDTGIDVAHPNLKGQVSDAKDFSKSGSTTDRFGHGTHVASIIAGTGKRGGPGMRGVAYEAKLLNGKVLGNDGYGNESDIIKGMEWAAKNGADVINMSLGGGSGNGGDPMERSVDALSKQYGTVFAIAAGNSGEEGTGLVSSPSTAASAISVAAVDSRNRRAPFSDTGPGRGNGALKPDVSAPGVGIRGARSQFLRWTNSPNVRMSGTSMAAPHVAGAAALLAQARPDLSGSELKSVLMGGATDRKANVWEEGTGTINIPGSIGMPVFAQEGSLSFGIVPFPQSKARDRVKTIHYKNTGSKPVTLTLKSDVTDAKGGKAKGVKFSKATLTVPAKGTASVRVTVAPDANPVGSYAGAITATPNKGHAIRTTLGWTNDVQRFKVTFKAIDRAGKPAAGPLSLLRVDKGAPPENRVVKGRLTVPLPKGTYSAGAFFTAGVGPKLSAVLAIDPQFTVKGDMTVILDGRKSQTMTATTPKRATLASMSYAYGRRSADGKGGVDFVVNGDDRFPVWVTPTKESTLGSSWFVDSATLIGPGESGGYDYQLAYHTKNRVPGSLKRTVATKDVATVISTFRATISAYVGVNWWRAFPGQTASTSVDQEMRIPSVVTSYLVGKGATWSTDAVGPIDWVLRGDDWTSSQSFTAAPGSTRRADFFTGLMSPGAVSGGAAYRHANQLVVNLPFFEDSAGRSGNGVSSTWPSLAAYVDGKAVAEVKGSEIAIPVPKGKNLRLVQKVQRGANWWGWTYDSTGEWTAPMPTENARVLPLMNIQYKLPGQSMSGTVKPGKQTIEVTVSQFSNPKYFRSGLITPKSLKVQWAPQGGSAAWRDANVTMKGKKAIVTFTAPAPKPGAVPTVSLRASASDGKGGTVTETMTSAYRLSTAASGK